MKTTNHHELLRAYAQDHSESAFQELVNRYVDLVYSAAIRRVSGDRQLAEDVTQEVFADLARKAAALPADVTLGGWLLRHTGYVASTVMRGEQRRRDREKQAVEMNTLNEPTEGGWRQFAPMLDEAMDDMDEADREALVLRYFEERELRAVGAALGITDDAAQKRVDRALEKLHVLLKHRGATLSAAALGTALATEAVTAAPAGLAGSVATTALAGAPAQGAAITLGKLVAMTTAHETLTVLALAAMAGAGLYQAHQTSSLRADAEVLHQQQAPLIQQILQLQRERDDATNRLASLADQIAKVGGNSAELTKLREQVALLRGSLMETNDPSVRTALTWKAKKERLQQLFEERPKQRIPEMQFLTDQQWLEIAKDSDLASEAGIASAMQKVRVAAQWDVLPVFQAALKNFMGSNAGNLPDNISELKPFLEPPLDEAILDRYRVLSGEPRRRWAGGGMALIEKTENAYETVFAVGTNGSCCFAPKTAAP